MEHTPPFHEQIRQERLRRGWSQDDLAKRVGCDVKTVRRWEIGERLPRPYHRQPLLSLFGKDAKAFGLIGVTPTPPSAVVPQSVSGERQTVENVSSLDRREDWHEAPAVANLYGREKERDELELWLQDQRCRVIAVSGMGGMGKSVLVAAAATHVKEHFECIFWRSLHAAPSLSVLLKQCLCLLSRQSPTYLPEGIDDLLQLLLPYLHSQRCLLVLDNFESVMQAGQRAGCYREGYTAYGRLIRLFAEARHQSCLVLISRQKPKEVACREGINSLVRARSLTGIEQAAGKELLKGRGLFGSERDWAALIERYSGNPLALQYASAPVREVFGGSIARFLQEEVNAFGEVSELLSQHFQRLSDDEREILYWLAIEHEALPLDALREKLARPMPGAALLDLLDSLRRRSLIETGSAAHYALPAIFKDYVIGCLLERASLEFIAEMHGVWMSHALTHVKSRDYTRENQSISLPALLAERLMVTLGKKGIEQRAKRLLATQRGQALQRHDYLTSNILSLLNHAGCALRGQTGRSRVAASSADRHLHAIHSEGGTTRELVVVEN